MTGYIVRPHLEIVVGPDENMRPCGVCAGVESRRSAPVVREDDRTYVQFRTPGLDDCL